MDQHGCFLCNETVRASFAEKTSLVRESIWLQWMIALRMLRIANDFLKDVALNPHKGFASNPHQLYDMLILHIRNYYYALTAGSNVAKNYASTGATFPGSTGADYDF